MAFGLGPSALSFEARRIGRSTPATFDSPPTYGAMSRMPGPGTGPVARVIRSALRRRGSRQPGGRDEPGRRRGFRQAQLGRRQRHRIAAEPQQPVESRTELTPEAIKAGI